MQVTFRCDGKVGPYRPGKIYTETLTPYLRMALKGPVLVLIDPLFLDEPAAPKLVKAPEPVVTAPEPKKYEAPAKAEVKDKEKSNEDKE